MIKINDVNFSYGDKKALDSLSLTLKREVIGLIGSNGSGKSTLMRLLSTLEQPNSGSIEYEGVSIYKLKREYLNKLGFCMQTTEAFQSLTSREYLQYFSCLKGLKKDSINHRIETLLTEFGLNNHSNKYMDQLSGGTLKRLGLCNALLTDPEILLLDEPTNGVDLNERVNLYNMIRNCSKERMVLISSHLTEELYDICDSIIFLKDGKCLFYGEPSQYLKLIEGRFYEYVSNSPIDFSMNHIVISSTKIRGTFTYRYVVEDGVLPIDSSQNIPPQFSDVFTYLCLRKEVC